MYKTNLRELPQNKDVCRLIIAHLATIKRIRIRIEICIEKAYKQKINVTYLVLFLYAFNCIFLCIMPFKTAY